MYPKKLYFVTGNINKFTEALKIFKSEKYELSQYKIDIDEYQGTSKDIAIKKCEEVVKTGYNNFPFIIEDVSLNFACLGGMPGPYIKWFLASMKAENLVKLVEPFEDKSALAICTLALKIDKNQEPIIFEGIARGRIVNPRGITNFGWDPIFEHDIEDGGLNMTYAEMNNNYKSTVSHRYKAFKQLQDYMNK
jgi:inosine triphosphate pyrophosphatase